MSESTVILESTWEALRSRVNAAFAEYLSLGSDCPDSLQEAMSYSVMAGGKRLRPILVLLACEACGGDAESALPAACAIELVHTYSLIHDDLPAMDDDELRRGHPTNHIVFGEAMAILAGDGLLTLAFEILSRRIQPPEVAAACCVDLAAAAGAAGMVGGQVADLEAERRKTSAESRMQDTAEEDLQVLQSIHERKTGRLLSCALTMGARIAGADFPTRKRLERYGHCFGLAFQIIDDLLDVLGSEEKMGKGVQKDVGQGKMTYPALLGVEKSRLRATDLIDEACRLLAPLEERGRRLEALAHFVLERDH